MFELVQEAEPKQRDVSQLSLEYDDDDSLYNITASTWTLATPKQLLRNPTTWEYGHYKLKKQGSASHSKKCIP